MEVITLNRPVVGLASMSVFDAAEDFVARQLNNACVSFGVQKCKDSGLYVRKHRFLALQPQNPIPDSRQTSISVFDLVFELTVGPALTATEGVPMSQIERFLDAIESDLHINRQEDMDEYTDTHYRDVLTLILSSGMV